ncbi:MAG: dihydropteroate synthase, partial [Thermoplasmata archaeon]|nr:dihydropteroate synthase [Thermoplasmata archaeon]
RPARVLELDGAAETVRELARTESDPEGDGIMSRKARIYPIRLEGISLRAAPLLKQELLAIGADSAHARGVADHSVRETSVVTLATIAQYRRVFPKLRRQPFGLAAVADALDRALTAYLDRFPRVIKGVRRSLSLSGAPQVMGVLNLTPDSFSDGGQYPTTAGALARAATMIEEGAAILDLGGESTRPGAAEASEEVEWARIAPVLSKLSAVSLVPISVDTRHAAVAARAIDAGADLINDVGGLRDPAMRRVLARTGAPAIAMHMRGTPTTMQTSTEYHDVLGEVFEALASATATAETDGIARNSLLIDPGLGFGKSSEQNFELLAHIGEFRSLGYPIVIGASRKSFLGAALGNAPITQRLEAGLAAAVIAAWEGVQLIRTHDVGPTVRALRFTQALRRTGRAGTANAANDGIDVD